MKKSKTFFACAMLVTLASCSSDHDLSQQNNTPSDPDVINIVAASSKPVTRAAQDAAKLQDTQFAVGEEINVYLSEHTTETPVITYGDPWIFKVSNSVGSNGEVTLTPPDGITPKFPSNNNGVDAYALYPTSVTTTDNGTFTVPVNQSDDEKYRSADMMFGTNSIDTDGDPISDFKGTQKGNNVQLYFKHQLSKIIVKMKTTSFDANFLDGATIKLYGAKKECTYKAGKNGITEISAKTDLGTGEFYNLGTYNANGNAGIIVPQTINKDTKFIEITTSGDSPKTYVYNIADEGGMTFVGGNQYTYNISLSGGKLVVVSVKIEDWNNVDKEGDADLVPES